jgi:hypothetical protein
VEQLPNDIQLLILDQFTLEDLFDSYDVINKDKNLIQLIENIKFQSAKEILKLFDFYHCRIEDLYMLEDLRLSVMKAIKLELSFVIQNELKTVSNETESIVNAILKGIKPKVNDNEYVSEFIKSNRMNKISRNAIFHLEMSKIKEIYELLKHEAIIPDVCDDIYEIYADSNFDPSMCINNYILRPLVNCFSYSDHIKLFRSLHISDVYTIYHELKGIVDKYNDDDKLECTCDYDGYDDKCSYHFDPSVIYK